MTSSRARTAVLRLVPASWKSNEGGPKSTERTERSCVACSAFAIRCQPPLSRHQRIVLQTSSASFSTRRTRGACGPEGERCDLLLLRCRRLLPCFPVSSPPSQLLHRRSRALAPHRHLPPRRPLRPHWSLRRFRCQCRCRCHWPLRAPSRASLSHRRASRLCPLSRPVVSFVNTPNYNPSRIDIINFHDRNNVQRRL